MELVQIFELSEYKRKGTQFSMPQLMPFRVILFPWLQQKRLCCYIFFILH